MHIHGLQFYKFLDLPNCNRCLQSKLNILLFLCPQTICYSENNVECYYQNKCQFVPTIFIQQALSSMSTSHCLGQQRHLPEHQMKKVHNFMFDLHDQIGSGYSSKVYQGKHCISGTSVAIKVIELKKLTNDIEKSLLSNQIKALTQLSHPNLLHALHTMQTVNNFYIVSSLYQQNLQNYLKNKGSFSEAETINFLLKMAQTLAYLEQNALIHRDIKPSNIFLSASNEYILGDLGFCQFTRTPSNVETGYNIGSPLYMSPQAYKNNTYSHKSDMWSLGICAIQLLCGKRPFNGITFDQMVNQVCNQKFYKLLPISDNLKNILDLILTFSCQRRASPKDLIEMLHSIGSHLPCQPLPLKQNVLQSRQNHQRSLSIRVPHSDKQINFKNLPKLKASPSTVIKNSPSMIVPTLIINSHRSIVSRPLSQRSNTGSLAELHHQVPNPKIVALEELYRMLIADVNLESNVNKIKLVKILSVLKPQSQLPTKIKQTVFEDPYFNHIEQSLAQHYQLFEISHYLVFLIDSVLKEYKVVQNEKDACEQKLVHTIKCLSRCLSLWKNPSKQKQNSNVSKIIMN